MTYSVFSFCKSFLIWKYNLKHSIIKKNKATQPKINMVILTEFSLSFPLKTNDTKPLIKTKIIVT